MAEYETLIVERHDAVTLIRFNRPEALHALNSQVLADAVEAFAAYDADPTQRCLVLTGDEKAFAAGADIKEMVDKDGVDFLRDDYCSEWTSRVTAIRKPWIAAVAGFALGGGCEVAMMADYIIAADTARFGQPEIRLGISPGMGGTQRMARAVGKAKAMNMMLTGRMMDADEAESAGLVARIVPAADLIAEAMKDAATIAAMPPLASLINKEVVNMAFETTLTQGLVTERRLFQMLATTQDKSEGMTAFVEKRPGIWKGR